MNQLIVLPMAAYVFYVFFLLTVSFRRRVKAVKSKEISIKHFTTYVGEAPESVIVAGRHFDNQFQLPIFYLVACTAHLVMGQVNGATLFLAWAFLASRMLHSYVHLGSNNVLLRMRFYFMGWIINLLLWGQLAYFVLRALPND